MEERKGYFLKLSNDLGGWFGMDRVFEYEEGVLVTVVRAMVKGEVGAESQ